jgi:ketosteroid isomerase-like protein
MHTVDTINKLYDAFSRLDAAGMAECYAPDVRFRDEAFKLVGRDEVMGMWAMLIDAVQKKGRADWQLTWSQVALEGQSATARWEARYRFSATGRLVHNVIDAHFTLDGRGLILNHHDQFDFWRWSRQALGAPGVLLGWTPFLRKQVRAKARNQLDRYLAHRASS